MEMRYALSFGLLELSCSLLDCERTSKRDLGNAISSYGTGTRSQLIYNQSADDDQLTHATQPLYVLHISWALYCIRLTGNFMLLCCAS